MFTQHTRLECKIAAWPLTTSSNNACDSTTVDTSHLGVTYPTKPVPLACTHPVVPLPGDNDWVAAEYSSQSWAALVEPVKPCTTTTTTTTQLYSNCFIQNRACSGSVVSDTNLQQPQCIAACLQNSACRCATLLPSNHVNRCRQETGTGHYALTGYEAVTKVEMNAC